ncbi:MAG: hypothetical protein ACOC5F_02765 [Candidatus Aminicenantaceae bacterium]
MTYRNNSKGKVVPILLLIIFFVACALGGGYYLSQLRFNKKFEELSTRFEELESKHEMILSNLDRDVKKIQIHLREKEGQAVEESKNLKRLSFLLEAKGEVISGKLSLSRSEVKKSLEHIDNAIKVLKSASEFSEEKEQGIIEDIRLRLATVKGIIEANSKKAQDKLDQLWREIDKLIIQ